MPVRYLSDPELARLSNWPDEIAVEDAVTYFTLSADDLSWLAGFNRQQNRLGVAVQLSTLPWLGWIPDDLAACPPFALDRLALALGIAPDISSALLAEYGGWQGRTRREHRARVLARLGWRLCAAGERKLLDEFLLARALEHDAPGSLHLPTVRRMSRRRRTTAPAGYRTTSSTPSRTRADTAVSYATRKRRSFRSRAESHRGWRWARAQNRTPEPSDGYGTPYKGTSPPTGRGVGHIAGRHRRGSLALGAVLRRNG
jgi:hypothetical protein